MKTTGQRLKFMNAAWLMMMMVASAISLAVFIGESRLARTYKAQRDECRQLYKAAVDNMTNYVVKPIEQPIKLVQICTYSNAAIGTNVTVWINVEPPANLTAHKP